jgi:hypothetical protein
MFITEQYTCYILIIAYLKSDQMIKKHVACSKLHENVTVSHPVVVLTASQHSYLQY